MRAWRSRRPPILPRLLRSPAIPLLCMPLQQRHSFEQPLLSASKINRLEAGSTGQFSSPPPIRSCVSFFFLLERNLVAILSDGSRRRKRTRHHPSITFRFVSFLVVRGGPPSAVHPIPRRRFATRFKKLVEFVKIQQVWWRPIFKN